MKIFSLVILTFESIITFSQPAGTLDQNFWQNGAVLNAFNFTQCYAIATTQDGKILAAGVGDNSKGKFGKLVVRYNSDGSVDTKFGNNGKIISKEAYTIALIEQKDGKVIIGGIGNSFTLRCFLSNGDIDTTFGQNGSIGNIFSGYSQEVHAITQLADGKFITLATGTKQNANNQDILLARYNANGSTDLSFGDSGRIVKDFGAFEDPQDIQLQPDGRFIVAGNVSNVDEGLSVFVSRFMADGNVDENFGSEGWVTRRIFTSSICSNIALQLDGKIVIPVYSRSSPLQFALLRYNADGSVDNSFGKSGKVLTDLPNSDNEYLVDAIIDDNGKILGAGKSNSLFISDGEMTIIRYNNDGSIDEGFGKNGITYIDFDDENYSEAVKLAKQSNGKIVIGGSNYNFIKSPSTSEFALVRLRNDGIIDSSFGNNGKQVSSFSSYDYLYNMILQNDGKILTLGTDGEEANSILARYYGDPVKQLGPIAKKIRRWIRNHTLQWQPLNDNSISYYSVQQSSNGVSGFKEIGRIAAVNRQSSNVYSYNLNSSTSNQQPSSNYYRVTAVSNSGDNIVSDVIADDNAFTVNVSPNPVKDVLKISGLPANQKTVINIVNRNGNVLQSATAQSSCYNMNVSQLKSGVYNVVVTINNKTQSIKFVKE